MHSTLNSLVMIIFTRPYRDAVIRWILGRTIVQWILQKLGGGTNEAKQKISPSAVFATEMVAMNIQMKKRRNAFRIMEVLKKMGT